MASWLMIIWQNSSSYRAPQILLWLFKCMLLGCGICNFKNEKRGFGSRKCVPADMSLHAALGDSTQYLWFGKFEASIMFSWRKDGILPLKPQSFMRPRLLQASGGKLLLLEPLSYIWANNLEEKSSDLAHASEMASGSWVGLAQKRLLFFSSKSMWIVNCPARQTIKTALQNSISYHRILAIRDNRYCKGCVLRTRYSFVYSERHRISVKQMNIKLRPEQLTLILH